MATIRQDSNQTGLRYALEASLKTLPGSPVWKQFEPNSYGDFGSQVAKVARKPINADRSNKKAVTTDLDASAGFNQDLTMVNTFDALQGFFFADAREKATTAPINGSAAVVITSVTTAPNTYTAAAGLGGFKVGAIVMAAGFAALANNGLKNVTTVAAGVLTVNEVLTVDAAPAATAYVETVGFKAAASDLTITMAGNIPTLNSTTLDFTTLGLVVGEWIFLGDDTVGNRFANNVGFARLASIAAHAMVFDKTSWTPIADAGTGKTVAMYFGKVLKNELAALIKRRSYQLERTLGSDDVGPQSEVVTGAVANELTVTVPKADKVTIDLKFIGCDHELRNGTVGLKAGARPLLPSAAALNTSSDMVRMKMSLVDATTSVVTPLFAFMDNITLKISNGVTPEKALGVLGAFDTVAGNFDVSGNVEAFFATTDAVAAVRNNSDVTLDVIMVEVNRGYILDIPLIQLGNGRLNVEQDKSVKIPLDNMAAQSAAGHTLLMQQFNYLPNIAG